MKTFEMYVQSHTFQICGHWAECGVYTSNGMEWKLESK